MPAAFLFCAPGCIICALYYVGNGNTKKRVEMISLVPDYYFDFRCKAGKCRHSCCEGWEVDIDPVSFARYQADGLGHIAMEDGVAHFELTPDLRCPYLNGEGLCELIIDHGEDYLCQICTDHPRFRNYWTGITETGLGLSCEECAGIILSADRPFKLVSMDGTDIDEKALIASLPEDEQYLWNVRSELLRDAAGISDSMTARFTEYLIFRHIPDALYDDRLKQRVKFVQYCLDSILDAWDASPDQSEDALFETARRFSAEIEYNEIRKNELIASM